MSISNKTTTGIFLLAAMISLPAQAQMSPQPWTFVQQNRASIAALMQQTENPAGTTAPPSADTIICGGGSGQSAATANSSCIILNKGTGQIDIGQDSNGGQQANNTQPPLPPTGSDAVAAALADGLSGAIN